MSLRRRGGGGDALNPWPGYVDALSTLLMVIIFVLLVFVLAQAFLGVALTGKDQALERLNRQMSELSDMLSLERGRTTDLQGVVAGLTRDLASATQGRDQLSAQVGDLQTQVAAAETRRAGLQTERDRLAAQLADTALLSQTAAGRAEQLQQRLADAVGRNDAAAQAAATAAAQLADAQRKLAQVQAELDRTVSADRATIQARVADLAKLTDQVNALTALRDELRAQVRTAETHAAAEQDLSESGRAQIALLNHQVSELRAQLAQLAAALDVSAKASAGKDVQIADLGTKLNTALASKVEELQRYRSEFFGRLRDVLANRPGVQVAGDRFVFQSEVLFPVGSADMTGPGQDQIRALAATLKTVGKEIPPDIAWIMRVDGHADPSPMKTAAFASNWELSSARAINVVKLLIAEGVPANHLAATGFAEFQPFAAGDTPDAYARDRRIELRLTDR